MVARARWLVIRPRTSLCDTPALRQSIGMIVALMYVRATVLAGLAIDHRRLRRTHRLPRFDAAAEEGIDRLGERRPRLVDGDIAPVSRGRHRRSVASGCSRRAGA